ncbi:hypothetical protein [Antarcticirhabdus aurantiaca]|uniref:Uncharacterized protein n=1 Tax=Antarcticirhabdus aurantiaca TaxID=2606717 RepID=A0ACD4NQW1_9HYPH|nr:hypothetical protein [Antarcticirhabdus aurantiaca]WAJ29286.1 hypothetical protein OXU80_03350 [Jeongeuplla avenae]
MLRHPRAALALLAPAALAATMAAPAMAQDGTAPREIPEGFVVPGPTPTNASPGSEAVPARPAPPATPAPGAVRPEALAAAPPPATTDWPCVQRKVGEIAAAAIWSGPDLGAAAQAPRDADMAVLVDTIASRRTPLPDAEAAARAFADALPVEERAPKVSAVFTDLLGRLNAERGRIIRGIERYGARQKQFAEALRERRAAFDALRESGADRQAVQAARDALLLDQRIFDERRQSLTYVCEVPTLIEQRAFGLGRTLAASLKE